MSGHHYYVHLDFHRCANLSNPQEKNPLEIWVISKEITYYPHARFQMPPHPISSISRIFFNGTPVVLFTALFLKGCGHDFP